MKIQGSKNIPNNLEEEHVPSFKSYLKDKVMKVMWYRHNDRLLDQ